MDCSILIVIVPGLIGLFCLWRVGVNSGKVYAGLDDIWARAKKATNQQELKALKIELCKYHADYCHVRPYGDYARRVLAYIDGRLAG
jgi:hypothetical protein